MEDKEFINFLSNYTNREALLKTDYDVLLKEIDSNFNKINNINNISNNTVCKINDKILLKNTNINKESENECIDNLNSVLKYGSVGNILLDSKLNNIKEMMIEYNYIKKYKDETKNENIDNKKLIKVNIKCKINSIEDLLDLIDNNEFRPQVEYNINLEALHKIKDDLINLNNLIGLKKIKESILDQLLYFLQGLHLVDNKNNDYKHMVLYGPPGTGKTEIAKIIGKIYSKIGILSKNIFKKACRSDLIGGYLGQTAIKTDKLIKECLGGVLFIDEAYSLANTNENTDSYSKECLDTLNECLSNYKDDLIVIIAGYERELDETFFKTNAGLKSRFVWRFEMEEYNYEELYKIFSFMINKIDWELDKNITKEWFFKKYDNFSNFGRDIETLITHVKISHGRRLYGSDSKSKEITEEDLDNGFKRYIDNRTKNKNPNLLNSIYI